MDGMVLPDLTKPLTKKIKEGTIMMEKLYMPFMDLYFDTGGTVTNTVTLVGNKLVDKLLKMIEVMQGLYKETEEKNETERKKEDPQEEKKRSWIMERWQKIIKLGFFQKTLGFLKGLASVSFITELLTFLILLRLGIFQRFLPLIGSVMGSALQSLIRAIPSIIKFIWKMLSKTLPGILKSVFNTALKTLGLKNEGFFILADVLAEGLPILLAIVWAFSKLGPIISGIGGFISGIGGFISGVGSVLAFIGLAIIKLLALVGIVVALPAWVVGAIAVAVVALGALIWTFRKQIGDFLTGLWDGITEVFFSLIGSIGEYISEAWHSIIVKPIQRIFRALRRMADPVFKTISPIVDAVSGIFGTIDTQINSMIDSIKTGLDSMLSWFSNVSDFGMYDWMTMDKDKKAKFTEKQAELREDPLVQFAEKKITEEQAAQRLGMKDGQLSPGQMAEVEKMRSLQTGKFANTEIATIIASEMAGVIKDINSDHGKQSGIIGTLTFVKNNSSTKGSQ